MKINYQEVENVIKRARRLNEMIETSERQLNQLQNSDRQIKLYLDGSEITHKLDSKTIAVIAVLTTNDLSAYKEPLEKELNDILTGGIKYD